MNTSRLSYLMSTLCIGGLCSAALAQLDNSTWPTFKGNSSRTNSTTAPGPAVAPAWTLENVGSTSTGGPSIAANGDIYFKTNDSAVKVYRVSPAGAILATSIDFAPSGGGGGHYSGVTITPNSVWTTIHSAGTTDGLSKLVEMNKSTLAVIRTITDPAFVGMRGTPAMSTFANGPAGSYTIYVGDRNGNKIHAVDVATGTVRWSFVYSGTACPFDQVGPLWVVNGKQRIAYFRNTTAFPGLCLEDNGDGSQPNVVWEGSPDSFNWFGSGVLSADQTAIYVTTFNDGDVPSLWKIDINNGSVIWSVPGARGTCTELNFFTRPCVIGNRIYCGGGNGVVTCFVDAGPTVSQAWEYRVDRGEMTGIAAVQTPGGQRYVYALPQEVYEFTTDPGIARGFSELHVLQDLGTSYALLTRNSLGGAIKPSIFAGNCPAIAADGSIYFGSGLRDNPTGYRFYKFTPGSPAAATGRCCMPSGACQQLTQAACTSGGGTYGGDNTLCNPTNPTVASASPNIAIPDGDVIGVSSTVHVANSFTVSDVNVTVNIPDHTWIADLIISLTHGGTNVALWVQGCQFVPRTGLVATFDDEADFFPCLCMISGSGNPSGDNSLSAFDGADAAGDWTLNVADVSAGDVGTLVDWSVRIGGPNDPCGPQGCPNPGSSGHHCTVDLNGDCQISLTDLTAFLAAFGFSTGQPGFNPATDYDHNGSTGLSDLTLFLGQFGDVCH